MKKFYLLRHEDLHGHAGLGTVAEGVIFDNGLVAMTWLTKYETVTMFQNIKAVKHLHSHEGRTEVIVEGNARTEKKFLRCIEEAKARKRELKAAKENEGE